MRVRHIFSFIILCMYFASCSDTNPLSDEAYVYRSDATLELLTSVLYFESTASTVYLVVNTNSGYSVSSDVSWLSFDCRGQSVTVYCLANNSSSPRTATITVKASGVTRTISVSQKAGSGTNTDSDTDDSSSRTFTVTSNGQIVSFKMIKVEGGTFQMGSTTGDSDEQPVHIVTITNDYYMCETEVTNELWAAIMGVIPSKKNSGDTYPVEYISYDDCQSFLPALNGKLSSQLGSDEQFRFPTEAEWEFAAKGGNKSKGYTYAGSNTIDDVAWYGGNSSSTTHPVKTKSPNELGLYDMCGNVDEWCYDWYGSYNNTTQTDPTGPTSGSYRVIRGGGWTTAATSCSLASRGRPWSSYRYYSIGLRLCLGASIE